MVLVSASSSRYKICNRCIMDTSGPSILFDERGHCDYCNNFDGLIQPNWDTGSQGARKLAQLADAISHAGKGNDFDCIIGLSGGLDSSYVAYIAKEKMGLRPLLFHVDAGWNTDQAVGNIEKLVDGLGLDLYTDVVNWGAVKRMQVAFLRAGIPDQDLVQDAAFFSGLYRFARKYKISTSSPAPTFQPNAAGSPKSGVVTSESIKHCLEIFGRSVVMANPMTSFRWWTFWFTSSGIRRFWA